MLVGKEGRYEKPTHPCLVPGCNGKSFQAEKGACKKHMFEKIAWLRRRVMASSARSKEVIYALEQPTDTSGKRTAS